MYPGKRERRELGGGSSTWLGLGLGLGLGLRLGLGVGLGLGLGRLDHARERGAPRVASALERAELLVGGWRGHQVKTS